MKQESKVTLGVCVRNAEQTVEFAIKSILKQDFPRDRMELIVVDGSSKDNTMTIIRRQLATEALRTKFFTEDAGLGFARQIVVDNAWGEYVIWVDGDMVLPKNHVRKQVDFMNAHPLSGIGRARYGIWRDSGPVAFLENIPFVVESLKSRTEVPLEMCGTEGSIYRVEAMRQAGGFDILFRGAAEDTDLARRILYAGWKAYVTDAFFYELCKESWEDLWNQYFWWGQGWHYYFHKGRPRSQKELGVLVKLSPLGGFFAGILRLPFAYTLTGRKVLFMLPFHYVFKRFAFCYGINKAHLEGYGH